MNHHYFAENNVCSLSPLKKENIESLRKWRNDRKNSEYLRPIPYITSDMEEKWFDEYLEDNSCCFFAVTDKDAHKVVGSLALYNLKPNLCEIGKIIIGDDFSHGRGIGYNSFLLAICIGIRKLNIERFHLDVHTDNIPALSIYIKTGFEVVGSHDFINGGKELEMEIDRNRFEICNPAYRDVRVWTD